MTINDTWGYKSYDTNFKSTETLLQNLIDIASKGGNYLLNIGPDSQGVVPAPEVERLHQMGKWLAVNGEAIYGTQPTLFGPEAGASAPQRRTGGQAEVHPRVELALDHNAPTKSTLSFSHGPQVIPSTFRNRLERSPSISARRLRAHAAEDYD